MVNRIRTRWTLVGITAILLLMIFACSEEATPTATPSSPDIGASVQQAVQQAMADRPSGTPRAFGGGNSLSG